MSDRKLPFDAGNVLTEAETAALLKEEFPQLARSQKTLRNLRYAHPPSGPPFVIIRRRVFYPRAALLAWARAQYSALLASRRELPDQGGVCSCAHVEVHRGR